MSVRVQSSADIILNARERVFWMYPICFPGCLCMLYAPRGIGKSLITLWLAVCLAAKTRFFKFLPDVELRTLVIDGEMGTDEIFPRLSEFGSHVSFDSDSLHFITPDQCDDYRVPNLADAAGQAEVNSILNDKKINLVIVDTLTTCVRPLPREDECQTWDRYERWLVAQRALGRMVLTVHHAGKSGDQLGTSKKEQIQNIIISLKNPMDYEMSEGARFVLSFTKMRHGKGFDVESLNIHYDPTLSPPWKWSAQHNELENQVLDMTAAKMNPKDIAQALGVSLYKVKKLLLRDRLDVEPLDETNLEKYF